MSRKTALWGITMHSGRVTGQPEVKCPSCAKHANRGSGRDLGEQVSERRRRGLIPRNALHVRNSHAEPAGMDADISGRMSARKRQSVSRQHFMSSVLSTALPTGDLHRTGGRQPSRGADRSNSGTGADAPRNADKLKPTTPAQSCWYLSAPRSACGRVRRSQMGRPRR